MNTLLATMIVAEGLSAIGFMISPGPFLGPFGVVVDDVSTTAFRVLGSALGGLTVSLWFARKSASAEVKHTTLRSMLVYYLLSAVFFVIALAAGQMNALGWILVGIHLALATWGIVLLAVKSNLERI